MKESKSEHQKQLLRNSTYQAMEKEGILGKEAFQRKPYYMALTQPSSIKSGI